MADYELLRTQGAGPTALYAMIGESIGEALTNVLVRSSRPRGSAAAAGGETPPRTPPPCAGWNPKRPREFWVGGWGLYSGAGADGWGPN